MSAAVKNVEAPTVYLDINKLQEGKCYRFNPSLGPNMKVYSDPAIRWHTLRFNGRGFNERINMRNGRRDVLGIDGYFTDLYNNEDIIISLDSETPERVLKDNKCFTETFCPTSAPAAGAATGYASTAPAPATAAAPAPATAAAPAPATAAAPAPANNEDEDPRNPNSNNNARRSSRKRGGKRKTRKGKKSSKKSRKYSRKH
jgi:hypothetical protein